MNDTLPLTPTEYDTVERFGIHAPSTIDRDKLRGALTNVLCNASNFPRKVTPHILGQDMGPLIEKVTAAVIAHLSANETTATTLTPALAAEPEPTPVLACHLDCARQAILNGCMPTSKMTDYRIFRTGESLRGVLLHGEPLHVIAAGHTLHEDLVLSAAAARATIR